ncbi:uncharacterized protein LOC121730575 [Aricia agestis]|uniref:uncharacterized protein LOC121730575 n=1 Tax=Aricia agestis TaxID=91739 RepID=UPI001C20470A|nr:uncharacterized protein LOC121730575 [Aricia agestis]
MSLRQTCIKTVPIEETSFKIQAEFFYPKIVVIEDKLIRILDSVSEDNSCQNYVQNFETKIIDYMAYDNMLWLAFKSGEVVVANPHNNSILKLENTGYSTYIIHQFVQYNNQLYILTESGEYLTTSVSPKDIKSNLNNGTASLSMSYEKVHIPRVKKDEMKIWSNGIMYQLCSGNIKIQCPVTGLWEILSLNVEIQYLRLWSNMMVLASLKKMWLIDAKTYNTLFAFDENNGKFLPLAAHENTFYYLNWYDKEIQICCASISQDENQLSTGVFYPQQKSTSQDLLVRELKSLVSKIISEKLPHTEVFNKLKIYFTEIQDIEFLINIATQLCHHNIACKIVLYQLQKRIFENSCNQYKDLLCDIMIKVDLLEYIYFKRNGYEYLNIFEKSFIELCSLFISKSDMDLASICWLKYSEIKQDISHEDIVNILNAIPHNIKMSALVIWLRNFAPTLLEQNPFHIDLFVKWTTERVFLLEQSSYWPKIGLKFITAIVEILEKSIKTVNIRLISIDDLDSLKSHINYISDLKEKYRINMLLNEFSSLSPMEIALIMLRRCYTEDLAAFLQENLTSYASRNSFEMDDALRSFIESETASSGGSVDGQRLEILLNAFHSPSNKLDCLLQVLKVLDVPWNPTVLNIATEAALLANTDFTISESDKFIAQEIYTELNFAKIKVVLKKYNFPLTCTDYMLVIHKIVNVSEVNLEDLKVIANIMTSYTHYANTLYISRCLHDCETRMALDYFKDLSNCNKRVLIKTIEIKYEQVINGVTSNPIIERNYLDFLKGSNLLHKDKVKYLENLYHLKNSYELKTSLNNMCSENSCQSLLNTWKTEKGNIISSSSGRCITQLVDEHFSQHSEITKLLKRAATSQEIRKIIEDLIFSDSDGNKKKSVLSLFIDGQNSELLLSSYDILCEIVIHCKEETMHFLLQSLSMLNSLKNAHFILKDLSVAWKYQYVFLPMTSISALNELIHFYSKTPIEDTTEVELANIFNTNDFIPFRVLPPILEDSKSLVQTINMLEKFTRKIIIKLISSQEIDFILLTSLLLLLENTIAVEDQMWILDLLRGQSDSFSPLIINYLSLPVIRKTFSLEGILPRNIMSYPPQYILKLKFSINLDEITLPESNEETWDVKVLLFYILRNVPNMPFEKIIDLCHTLNISESDGLSLYLISLLSNWELKYKIVVNDVGYRNIHIENHEQELATKCNVIWQNIENKDFVRDILTDFWKSGEVIIHGCLVSVNPYYYEVFLCIYQLLYASSTESRNMKEYYLLHFLSQYKRKSPPKQYEFELFSEKGIFPEIGHYRLPFHLFMREDMWSNLKSEITLETYESWLPVVSLLSLDPDLQTAKDMICSNAVKQTMTNRKRTDSTEAESKDSEPWRLTTREEPLLRTAHRCVRHIANMEWAGACLFYVLQGCARGADQVAAAQLCYQFSQRWASLQPGNRAVRQMERLHSTLSTRHALHKIEWACEDLLKLVSEPTQLIHTLYSHPSFIDKIGRHDINRVANEIADKNAINISSIRIQILENILNKTKKDQKFSPGLATTDLIIAKYILKATHPKMGAIYLSRIAFDEDTEYNKCKKLRALQCLLSVIDPENAVKVTNRKRDELWSSLLDLLYIVHIEKIDMPWVISTYTQNKQLAISQLLQTSSGNLESLKIASEMAHRFGNAQIIREMIPLMLRHGVYEEMIPLLLKTLYPPDKLIYTAWRVVILSPFQQADYPITDRQKAKCLNALNLLPICPVIKDEDLIEIWKNCVRCKNLGLGCLILPYMTSQARQSLVELNKIDKRNLIIALKNLHTESYLVSGAMYVLENLTSKVHRK